MHRYFLTSEVHGTWQGIRELVTLKLSDCARRTSWCSFWTFGACWSWHREEGTRPFYSLVISSHLPFNQQWNSHSIYTESKLIKSGTGPGSIWCLAQYNRLRLTEYHKSGCVKTHTPADQLKKDFAMMSNSQEFTLKPVPTTSRPNRLRLSEWILDEKSNVKYVRSFGITKCKVHLPHSDLPISSLPAQHCPRQALVQ